MAYGAATGRSSIAVELIWRRLVSSMAPFNLSGSSARASRPIIQSAVGGACVRQKRPPARTLGGSFLWIRHTRLVPIQPTPSTAQAELNSTQLSSTELN